MRAASIVTGHAPESPRGPDAIAELARHGQVEDVFATPIFWHVLRDRDGLNGALRELVLQRERTTASVSRSNLGGWQSPPDFFEGEEPPVQALRRIVAAAVKIATARIRVPPTFKTEFDLYGWAAVNRKGHCNATHVHPGSTWSGTYYIDAGDEPPDAPGAALELSHPIAAAPMTFFPGILPSARLVRPEASLIILFPSYLQHSVRVYSGERPRVCVAFNAHLRP